MFEKKWKKIKILKKKVFSNTRHTIISMIANILIKKSGKICSSIIKKLKFRIVSKSRTANYIKLLKLRQTSFGFD